MGGESWVGDWFLDKGGDEWCIGFWRMSTMDDGLLSSGPMGE